MSIKNNIPRPEYPRPQMVRPEWINLNGVWDFETDNGKSGYERGLHKADKLSGKINVPFCPESKLSGVGNRDFMEAVWYRRDFIVPDEYKGKRAIVHFGASDYYTQVWINSEKAGEHIGGYTPFCFDITEYIKDDENTIHVCVFDDVRSGSQARGKQSEQYHSNGCDYTRTTGIWQTVWMEFLPDEYIASYKVTPDPENRCVHIRTKLFSESEKLSLKYEVSFKGEEAGTKTVSASGNICHTNVELEKIRLWEPGNPALYDLKLTLFKNGEVIDEVIGYFGLRTIEIRGKKVYLNEKPFFQRLVLDQGFYPEGIYTAPSKEDLKRDIEISMEMGFNGARLHQKVFEPLFLYYADKTGYPVWGEFADWGLDITQGEGLINILPQWMEAVERDYNHPCIIGWCPFNETWDRDGRKQNDEVVRQVYKTTKALDKTRPVIDASGNFHVETDIFDIHDYEQDPEVFSGKFDEMKSGGKPYVTYPDRQKYEGQPYFVSEYGGIWWNPEKRQGWGYGKAPESGEEFLERYEGLTSTLLENPGVSGFCYTQLYDIEQEVNGLYTYDRKPKFPPDTIRKINSKKARVEEI